MTEHNKLSERYKGNWKNKKDDCLLCDMEKRTEWYIETPRWVVAEKLGGGPFVVYKTHTKELSEDEWEQMEHVVGLVFDDFDISVTMNLVPEHWHGHILVDDRYVDLSDE